MKVTLRIPDDCEVVEVVIKRKTTSTNPSQDTFTAAAVWGQTSNHRRPYDPYWEDSPPYTTAV